MKKQVTKLIIDKSIVTPGTLSADTVTKMLPSLTIPVPVIPSLPKET